MSSELKHRRGTAAAHASFIGAQGEITIKTDTNEIVVHDGVTPGGWTGGGYLPAGTGAVARTVQDKLREWVSVEDFGAVGDGVADDTDAVQAALDSGAGIVHTGHTNKVYRVSRLVGRSNLRITGNGTFDFSGNVDYATSVLDPLFLFAGSAASPVPLTADAAAWATTLTVSSTTGLAAGDLIELATPGHTGGFGDPSVVVTNGETFEIASVDSATQVTLTTPVLHEDGYTVANGAQVRKITPVENVTIERDVKIIGKGRPASGSGDMGVVIFYGRNVHVHCQFKGVDASAVRFESCYEFSATHCRVEHDQQGANTTVNYGIVPSGSSKFGEIAYNFFRNMRHAVMTSHLSATLGAFYGVVRMVRVHHNTALNTWHAAYATHQDAELIFFEDNEAINCVFGVNPRERRMTVMRNKTVDCGQHIYLSGQPRKLTIADNQGYGGGNLLILGVAAGYDFNDVSIVRNKGYGTYGIVVAPGAAATTHKRLVVTDNELNSVPGAGGNDAAIRIKGSFSGPIVNRNIVNGTSNAVGIRIEGALTDGEVMGNSVRNVSGHAYQFVAGISNTYAKHNTAKGYGGSFVSGNSNLANSGTVLADNTDMGA